MRNLALVAAVAFMVSPAFAADDTEKILKEMEGNYTLKTLEVGGKPAPADMVKELKGISIKDGKIEIKLGERSDVAALKLDPKKAGNIDISPEGKDTVRKGLYKFEKGVLTIVFNREGDRPENLDAKGEATMKMVIEKKK